MDLTIPTALTLGPQEQGAVETSFDAPPVRLTGVFMDDGTAPGKHSVSGIKLRAMDRYQLQGEALSADQRRCLPTLWTGDFSAHHADPACAAAFGQVRSVRNCSIGLSSEGCWRPARACCRAGKPPAGFTERPAQTDALPDASIVRSPREERATFQGTGQRDSLRMAAIWSITTAPTRDRHILYICGRSLREVAPLHHIPGLPLGP
jgi:hypothetical protein